MYFYTLNMYARVLKIQYQYVATSYNLYIKDLLQLIFNMPMPPVTYAATGSYYHKIHIPML